MYGIKISTCIQDMGFRVRVGNKIVIPANSARSAERWLAMLPPTGYVSVCALHLGQSEATKRDAAKICAFDRGCPTR